MRVVVGLGNPGIRYRFTRHNVGFMVVEELSRKHEMQWKRTAITYHSAKGPVRGQQLVLVKPQSYMNRSGEVVASILNAVSASPDDLLVVHDDIDLSYGRIRIRKRGGAGGHKGVQSIIDAIASKEFQRIRMGIGRPECGEIEDYVLSRFSHEERAVLPDFIGRGVQALECMLSEGVDRAMNLFNSTACVSAR